MLYEQAFYSLPEFLVGTGFTRYDAEGTLVMAFSMAVLQELNGRNINNPVSLINAERHYIGTSSRTADLHVNQTPIGLLNSSLSAFGVRQESWLEAKFFRLGQAKAATSTKLAKPAAPTLDPLKGAYCILRDLLRLCVFPAQNIGSHPNAACYLLHVYENDHMLHLSLDRNVGKKKPRAPRGWLELIHKPGSQDLTLADLTKEPKTFDNEVGKPLRGVTGSIGVTNLSILTPTSAYKLYLTRLDRFNLDWNNLSIKLDNVAWEKSAGDWNAFRTDLDKHLVR